VETGEDGGEPARPGGLEHPAGAPERVGGGEHVARQAQRDGGHGHGKRRSRTRGGASSEGEPGVAAEQADVDGEDGRRSAGRPCHGPMWNVARVSWRVGEHHPLTKQRTICGVATST
jgi:hypothetical protein